MRSEKRILFVCICAFVILCFSATPVQANGTIVKVDNKYNTEREYTGIYGGTTYDFVVSLSPSSPTNCILSKTEKDICYAGFPNWLFINSSGLEFANGKFNIVHYDACLAEQKGSSLDWECAHKMQIDYDITGVSYDPQGEVLHWIQFVYTNYPKSGNPSTGYLDPTTWKGVKNFEDNLPFYWTESENKTNSDDGKVKLRFTDRPARPFSGVISRTPVTWEAHLYLALWDGDKTAGSVWVYHKGVKWGFKITATPTKKALPRSHVKYTHGGVAGDKFDWIPGEHLNDTADGGYVVPITIGDKSSSLAPHISASVAILVAAVAANIYFKRSRRIGKKQ